MREHPSLLAAVCLLLSAGVTVAAQDTGTRARRGAPSASPKSIGTEGREAAARALMRLRALRDGWNDVNRAFISRDRELGRKINAATYELQYMEAREDVARARAVLPGSELSTALAQAMGVFDDLEELWRIFDKRSPVTTLVGVADVFPYLKKYRVPYEEGMEPGATGYRLHKDFVLSYVLPRRYALVNRVEVLLGGESKPVPPPPTYEQMYRVPNPVPPLDRSRVKLDELKGIARRALEARRRGDRAAMSALLDDRFQFNGRGGRLWDKGTYLGKMEIDPTVKSFEIERAELRFSEDEPILAVLVNYELYLGGSRGFKNTFHFVDRGGRWLIRAWMSH